MASPSIDHLIQVAGALGLGGAVVKALELLARRKGAERREPANMTRAAAELSSALSEGSTELLDEFRREFRYLRGRVSELQTELDQGKADTAAALALAEAAQGDHARCQAEVKELKAQIDVLMAGPVATYGPRLST
jgi:chromosome segregation ATPase